MIMLQAIACSHQIVDVPWLISPGDTATKLRSVTRRFSSRQTATHQSDRDQNKDGSVEAILSESGSDASHTMRAYIEMAIQRNSSHLS
jgi:hypothetical protein